MSIKVKLIFSLTLLLALLASQVVITISQVGRVAELSSKIAKYDIEKIEQISHLSTGIELLREAEIKVIWLEDLYDDEKLIAKIEELLIGIQHDAESYLQQYRYASDYQSYAVANAAMLIDMAQSFVDSQWLIHTHLQAGDREAAANQYTQTEPAFTLLKESVHDFRHQDFSSIRKASSLVDKVAFQTKYLFIFALIVITLVEIGIGFYLLRSMTAGLSTLLTATRQIAAGDLTHEVKIDSEDEFMDLAHAFNGMIASLAETRSENSRLHGEALAMKEDYISLLRQRLSQVVKAQEDERQRIARELHDQAGQALTAIQLGLSRIETLSADNSQLAAEAGNLRQLTVDTMDEIRNLALDLRPSMLDELGLVPALRQYTREFSRRYQIEAGFEAEVPHRLIPDVEVAIFRAIQEALTNVAKHSEANQVKVQLIASNNGINATVVDNGKGFDVGQALQQKRSLGLFGIQERIELLGGTVQIESSGGLGTRVSLNVGLTMPAGNFNSNTN